MSQKGIAVDGYLQARCMPDNTIVIIAFDTSIRVTEAIDDRRFQYGHYRTLLGRQSVTINSMPNEHQPSDVSIVLTSTKRLKHAAKKNFWVHETNRWSPTSGLVSTPLTIQIPVNTIK
jgi:hypothetical protein